MNVWLKKVFDPTPSFNKVWNTKYYSNEPSINGICCRVNFSKKVKDGAYIINLDKYEDVGVNMIALYCTYIEITYFGSFGVP